MPIPTPTTSQPISLVIVSEISTPTVEEIADFCEDAVESLREYFWNKKEKDVVKKGTKRAREGTLMQGTVPNHIIWKRTSTYVKQEALETSASMGDFVGANYDSVSSLNKEIEVKE